MGVCVWGGGGGGVAVTLMLAVDNWRVMDGVSRSKSRSVSLVSMYSSVRTTRTSTVISDSRHNQGMQSRNKNKRNHVPAAK